MPNLSDRISAIEQIAPPDGFAAGCKLPREVVDGALGVFSDREFTALPLDRQFALLDFIQAAYIASYDPSAPIMAGAIQNVFQGYLDSGKIPLPRLLKTYDLLYFLYWCAAVSIEQQRGFDTDVVMPFSRFLRPRNRTAYGRVPREGGRTRLCYLAQFAHENGGNALAPVLEMLMVSLMAQCPDEYELFLYAWMYKDAGFIERIRSLGVTVRTFDLSEYRESELVRLRQTFFEDRIDVAITDMNSAVPHYLFERRVAPIQIFYQLGLPFWRLQNLEGVFQGWQIAPESLGIDADRCHAVPAPKSSRNLNPEVDQKKIQSERNRFPIADHVIGFYGRLVKITAAHCEILRSILERHPGTIAVLGGTGNAQAILSFIRDNGLEQRLFVVNEFVDGHVWGHMLDVFLDTFPLTGGYSCREVLAKGKPIVHMHSSDMPNLNSFLDGELQASDAREYVAHVSRLLSDETFCRRSCARSIEISNQQADLSPFASTLHSAVVRVMNSVISFGIGRLHL